MKNLLIIIPIIFIFAGCNQECPCIITSVAVTYTNPDTIYTIKFNNSNRDVGKYTTKTYYSIGDTIR